MVYVHVIRIVYAALAFSFLASDDAAWITGQITCVDGGYSVSGAL